MTLSSATRRRGLWVLFTNNFLMWAGFFMVVPLISVHYVEELGWAASTIGLILALRQLTQQGLAFGGGVVADQIGVKLPICVGMFVRGGGFLLMARADSFSLLLISALLAALGGAIFEAPKAAAVAALTTPETRSRAYAVLGVTGGLGLTIGPLLGALLLRVDFAAVALTAGSIFVITGIVTTIGLPSLRVASPQGGITAGLRLALRDRRFLAFTALVMGYWFMWVQLTISLPLIATDIAGTTDAVSWLYTINAVMTVVLQYPVLRFADRYLPPIVVMTLGVGTMALGLGMVPFVHETVPLLLAVVLFSAGALLASPSQQTVAANIAHPAALGSYFGVGALAMAFGGGAGNYLGGLLYQTGERHDLPALPWLAFATVGLLTAVGLAALSRQMHQARRLTADRPTAAQTSG